MSTKTERAGVVRRPIFALRQASGRPQKHEIANARNVEVCHCDEPSEEAIWFSAVHQIASSKLLAMTPLNQTRQNGKQEVRDQMSDSRV
jgi:xanthine dehydrogenase iron-sulfur cluster and FAD-binding subunit A